MERLRRFARMAWIVARVGITGVLGLVAIAVFPFGGFLWLFSDPFGSAYFLVVHGLGPISTSTREDALFYVWLRKEGYEDMLIGIAFGVVAYLVWPLRKPRLRIEWPEPKPKKPTE